MVHITTTRQTSGKKSDEFFDTDVDIQVGSSESSFAKGIFDGDKTEQAWDSLDNRLRERLNTLARKPI